MSPQATLKAHSDGKLVAGFGGHSVSLGTFSKSAADRALKQHAGMPLASFVSGRRKTDREIDQLVRRLARLGILEFAVRRSAGSGDDVVIEPQTPDYWPRTPPLRDGDTVVLSRFAYLRRRGTDMVLESPLAVAVFKLCNRQIAAALTALTEPQPIKRLRRLDGFRGTELLALLLDGRMLFKVAAADDKGLRPAEGDDHLVLWDFHDLLFHARSTEGRHANPVGGLTPYAGTIAPLPAVRPQWPGKHIALRELSAAQAPPQSAFAKLLRERHSKREFDPQRPITLAELACFLEATARVVSGAAGAVAAATDGPQVEYAPRPYPSAGASYALELYLAVNECDGLARGFYHYDAGAHALAPVETRTEEFEALLTGAQFAMGSASPPQILITMAARFGRVNWKYSAIAYSLILKDVGVLLQTFYLTATDMGLGGCAIGIANVALFAKMTGIDFHIEGPVGQFALGRSARHEPAGH